MPQQTTFKAFSRCAISYFPNQFAIAFGQIASNAGNMPGRGGSGSGKVTLSGQTVLLHVSPLACRNVRANSAGCGCTTLRCCRNSSRFSRSASARAVSVSSSSSSSGSSSSGGSISSRVTSSHLKKMLSQHPVLVTCQVDRRFGLQRLATTSPVTLG